MSCRINTIQVVMMLERTIYLNRSIYILRFVFVIMILRSAFGFNGRIRTDAIRQLLSGRKLARKYSKGSLHSFVYPL